MRGQAVFQGMLVREVLRCLGQRSGTRHCDNVHNPASQKVPTVPTYVIQHPIRAHEARYTLASLGHALAFWLRAWWVHACAEPISVAGTRGRDRGQTTGRSRVRRTSTCLVAVWVARVHDSRE